MSDSSAIRAGAAYVEISTKDAALYKGLQRAQAKLQAWGTAINAIGSRVFALGGAALGGLGLAARSFAETGSELNDMSARTGVSVEALSELGFVARQGGSNMEEMEGAIRHMQRSLVGAADGSQEAVDALANLGLTASDLANMRPDQQLERIGTALDGVGNAASRTALAMAIFGRTGTRGLAWFADMERGRAQAREFGLTISTDMARRADALGDAFDLLKMTGSRALTGIGAALAPAATALAEAFAKIMKGVNSWIDANPRAFTAALGGAAAFTALGATLVGVGVGLRLLGTALSGPMLAMRAFSTLFHAGVAIAGFLLPLVAAVAPLVVFGLTIKNIAANTGGLGSAIRDIGNGFSGAWSLASRGLTELQRLFGEATSFMGDAWQGVVNAISAGDLALAGEVAMSALRAGWSATMAYLSERWTQFQEWFADSFGITVRGVWTRMVQGFAIAVAGMRAIWATGEWTFEAAQTGLAGGADVATTWLLNLGSSPDVAAASNAQAFGGAVDAANALPGSPMGALEQIAADLSVALAAIPTSGGNIPFGGANQNQLDNAAAAAWIEFQTNLVNAQIAAEEAAARRQAAAQGRGDEEGLGTKGSAAGTFSAVAAAGLAGNGFQRQLLQQGQQNNAQNQQLIAAVAQVAQGFNGIGALVPVFQ